VGYAVIDLNNKPSQIDTPDQIRSRVKEDYIIVKKLKPSSVFSVPQKLHDLIQNPETGAVYCEPTNKIFPSLHPYLQISFEPEIIAIKIELFTDENVNLNSLFDTIVRIYNKAIVRRV